MDDNSNSKNALSSDTVRTTRSEAEKGEILKRCFINILKCLRVCKKTSKNTKNAH